MPVYYIVFVIIMPALIYLDYAAYKKRMRKLLEEQPDYHENQENYGLLLQKLETKQKQSSIMVGIVLCLAALLLGISVILSSGAAA